MTASIILAAGASKRLGRPKQTLRYKNKTLLSHAIDSASNAGIDAVVIVIGANEPEILAQLTLENIAVVFNEDWHTGA